MTKNGQSLELVSPNHSKKLSTSQMTTNLLGSDVMTYVQLDINPPNENRSIKAAVTYRSKPLTILFSRIFIDKLGINNILSLSYFHDHQITYKFSFLLFLWILCILSERLISSWNFIWWLFSVFFQTPWSGLPTIDRPDRWRYFVLGRNDKSTTSQRFC